MLYQILRFFARITILSFFRRLYWMDAHLIPKTGPLLIACNHPMAFTEACIAACFMPRPVHFLVRGDVFVKKWQWFFRATNQIPIYRFRDGFQNLRKNASSFAEVEKRLVEGHAIILFPEGNTALLKRLAPLQRGMAKIAYNTVTNQGVRDLQILPMGITYADGLAFHSDVYVRFGQPLSVAHFIDQYANDQKNGIVALTELVQQKMKPLLVHIDYQVDQDIAEKGLTMLTRDISDGHFLGQSTSSNAFEKRLAWIDKVGQNDDVQVLQHLSNQISEVKRYWLHIIGLILLLPFAAMGFVLNAGPFYLAKRIAKQRVKIVEFHTPVRLGSWMILELFYILIIGIIGAFWLGWIALLIMIGIPFLGWITKVWFELWIRMFRNKN